MTDDLYCHHSALIYCRFCNQGVTGQHEENCPNTLMGWECPNCGRIYAFWVRECSPCNEIARIAYDSVEEMMADLDE